MTHLRLTLGPYDFTGRLEAETAPKTCAAILARLPFETQMVHVRWSGEAVWAPWGSGLRGPGRERHQLSRPRPDAALSRRDQ